MLRRSKDESKMCCQGMIAFGLKSLFWILKQSYVGSFKLSIEKSDREKFKNELAVRKFDSILEEELQEFWEVRWVDADLLEKALRQAFEEIFDAVEKIKICSRES